MISIKREQFHVQIRRKRNDLEFQKKRNTSTINLDQLLINNQSPELIRQLIANIDINHQIPEKLDFLIPLLQTQNNYLKETLFLLSTVLHNSEAQQFEDFFEYSKLNEFLMEILKSASEQDLDLLDILFELLAHLCQKSLLIKSSFVSNDMIVILHHILPNVDVCLHDYCCDSLLELINVLVNLDSRIPLGKLQLLLPCLNEIAKKMRMINYIKPDLQQEDCELIDEQRWSVLYKFTTAIRGLSELSNFEINFCEFKSLWIILLELTFEQQFNVKLRLYGLISLALISIGTSIGIMNYQPDICFNLLMLLEIHKENEEKIRVNTAIILRNIFAIENENIVDMIHTCEIPYKFISLSKGETSIKVIYQELECVFNILSNCNQDQANMIVKQGLIEMIKVQIEYVMNVKDWGCIKQCIKVIFALMKYNQKNNEIVEQLKKNQIQKYLEWMTIIEKKSIQERASKVLQYFELL